MSIDYSKLVMSLNASSNKVALEGSASLYIPAATTGQLVYEVATIPHNLGTDNLLFQVSTNGGPSDGVMLPWDSGHIRMIQYASIDDTNLYISVISGDTSGYGVGAYTIDYFYRILIP